jgi:hypothetical protein
MFNARVTLLCYLVGKVGLPTGILVLKIENPHLIVRLSDDLLKIDLKGSLKNEIEEAI